MQPNELKKLIKTEATRLGFDRCGVAAAVPSAFKAEFRDWLESGYHGEMAYMARHPDSRLDPRQSLASAKSVVVVAMNYYTGEDPPPAPEEAVFARYARGDDYHDVIKTRLEGLLCRIREASPEEFEARIYVDTGPLLEREIAHRAGLGWFGKNTMLIDTRGGSYFLLGEILLSLELPPDSPARGGCGTCTRCLDACPTQAFPTPYVLDSRRCISYLTIELKGELPADLAVKIGNRIFGCDICQEVCPFNRRWAHPTLEPAFQAREAVRNRSLQELANLMEVEFREQFRGSAVKRAKWRGLRRNAEAGVASKE